MYCDSSKNIYYDEKKNLISKESYIANGINMIELFLKKHNYKIIKIDETNVRNYYYSSLRLCKFDSIMYDNIKLNMQDLARGIIDENKKLYGVLDMNTNEIISLSLVLYNEESIDSIYFDSSCSANKLQHNARIKTANYFLRAYVFLYENLSSNIRDLRGEIERGNKDFLIKYHTKNKCIVKYVEDRGTYKYTCYFCDFLNQFFQTLKQYETLDRGNAINYAVSIVNSNVKVKNVKIKEETDYTEISSPQSSVSFQYFYNYELFEIECMNAMNTEDKICIPSKHLIGKIRL
jgi:hypothetical protein